MSDIDLSEFAAVAPPKADCWFERLTDDQREKVTAARQAGFSVPTIVRVVAGWGVKTSESRVGAHLRGACSCG